YLSNEQIRQSHTATANQAQEMHSNRKSHCQDSKPKVAYIL
ncbi:hypothetical protein F441_08255, partial [Phytophthora nicotianae CJ01A1]